jgi:long-chain acyl-CoA synthetase
MNLNDSALVHGGLLAAVNRLPNKTALVCDQQSYTYSDIVSRAHSFAAQVDQHLARRVALCVPNSPAVVDVFFGTLMAGGCLFLFDPGWPHVLLRTLLSEHSPDILVAPEDVLSNQECALETTLGLSGAEMGTALDCSRVSIALRSQLSPDMSFLVGFTSGSSGPPKGFVRSHVTWTESFKHSAIEFELTQADCVLAPGPLSHGLSLYAVIEALCTGATAVIQSQFDTSNVLSAIYTRQASVLVVVPTMLDAIVERAIEQSFSSVTRLVTAGAKLSPSLRHRAGRIFPNAEIIEYYGASELSFISVAKGSEDCPPSSVGRPFSGVEIEVRDERRQTVDVGDVGTIWVKSDMLCSGYVGRTDGSGMRIDGAWATVGDFGHEDAEGYLYLDGREGSAITSAGYTVYPSAIESVLFSYPGVADVAVMGVPHPRWGEIIAAAVVPAVGALISEAELSEHCQSVLEPYACPRLWTITDHLKRTQSGKIDRVALRAQFSSGSI